MAVASVVKGGAQAEQVTVYRETKYCIIIMLLMFSALKTKLLLQVFNPLPSLDSPFV